MFLKNILLFLSFVSFGSFQSLAMDSDRLEREFNHEAYKEHYSYTGDPFTHWLSQPSGIASNTGDEQVVVSMTTHPPRIRTTYLALESILRQTRKPDKIIVYVAREDFPSGEDAIPLTLRQLKNRGVEIRFSDTNYRVATKLIPALIDFPEAVIITADDDRVYSERLLEILLSQHTKYPGTIISPHTRKYVWDNSNSGHPRINYLDQDLVYSGLGGISSNSQSDVYSTRDVYGDIYGASDVYGHGHRETISDKPTLGLIFEGFSGVLYPPHALHQEVFNFENFKRLTPCADDIWFQVMALRQGTPVIGLDKATAKLIYWPKEIDGTQVSGLFHQHLSANDTMSYRALYHYGLLDKLGFPELDKMNCQACKRTIPLVRDGQEFPHLSGKKGSKCKACLNDNLKKLLFIGAYDYGNIGDGLYKIIFDHYFGKNFDVTFIPDTVRANSKGQYIPFNSSETDFDFDALIIGGGGIIKDFESNSSIRYYMELAAKVGRPFFMVSVGMQTNKPNLDAKQAKNIIGSSVDLLRKASVILPRSIKDYQILKEVLGKGFQGSMIPSPDLGYLYPRVLSLAPVEKKYVTLIQTGSANVNQEYIRGLIAQKLNEFDTAKLVVMNMGGVEHPGKPKDFREYDLFAVDTPRYFPDAKIYMGDSLSRELVELRHSGVSLRQSDLTPQKAARIIAKSHFVISGRYHGLVLADAFGVPRKSGIFTFKCNAEEEWSGISPHTVEQKLKWLQYFIENDSASIPSPASWNEDKRNYFIVIASEKYPEMTIPYIQAMDNQSIYNLLAFGKDK